MKLEPVKIKIQYVGKVSTEVNQSWIDLSILSSNELRGVNGDMHIKADGLEEVGIKEIQFKIGTGESFDILIEDTNGGITLIERARDRGRLEKDLIVTSGLVRDKYKLIPDKSRLNLYRRERFHSVFGNSKVVKDYLPPNFQEK